MTSLSSRVETLTRRNRERTQGEWLVRELENERPRRTKTELLVAETTDRFEVRAKSQQWGKDDAAFIAAAANVVGDLIEDWNRLRAFAEWAEEMKFEPYSSGARAVLAGSVPPNQEEK